MTLRRKTLLIIGLTLIGLIGLLYGVSRVVLLKSYHHLELQEARRDVDRVAHALSESLEGLDRSTSDHAAWDKTYSFVRGKNPNYPSSAFPDDTYARLPPGVQANTPYSPRPIRQCVSWGTSAFLSGGDLDFLLGHGHGEAASERDTQHVTGQWPRDYLGRHRHLPGMSTRCRARKQPVRIKAVPNHTF